ncbi:unnamed protein product [Camellia sinensis]
MGNLTNDVSSSFPTPPPHAASMNPQAMASLQQAQALARGPFGQAYNFAVMTGVNASISCVMKRIRGKEDVQSRGRIWARIGLECDGVGAASPAFLFEITIGISADERDFYDVSIVDRYNLPLIASPPDVFQTSTQRAPIWIEEDIMGTFFGGYAMDNNYATKKRRKDLMEEFVALQHVVSSINYACAMYIVILHAAFKKKEIRLPLPRSPHPYGNQIDPLNRLVKDSDINCHDQLQMNRRTFMLLCGLVQSVGLSYSKYVVVLRPYGLLLKKPEPITANCTDDRWSYGTYVKVLAPAIDKPRYRTRKGEIATNVLGVCSQDMQFIYVLPGWEGSASDSRVVRDAVSTTSSHKKGKPRKFWNNREEVFLITTMKDVTASNPKWKLDNNQFRAGFYNECEKKILSAFLGTDLRATPHIDSKIKLCRKQYNTLQDMLKISGFGWDDEQKMVLVDSDDVWLNYVRRVPDAKGMRNRPFPFYEDWLILFGKDRATCELAKDPADAVAAMEKEDANATTEEGEQSPVEQFSMNMGDMDYSMSTSSNISNRADSTKTRKKIG